MKILNFGSINIDKCFKVKNIVKAGETIDSYDYKENIGGKGLNQSIALAKLDIDVYHAGLVNENDLFITKFLEDNNVNTHYIEKSIFPTGTAFIQIDKNGENSIVLNHGANYNIDKIHIDSTFKNFSNQDILLIQNEINSIEYIIKKACNIGMFVVLNPSPINQKLLDIGFKNIDFLIMNESEAKNITKEENIDKIIKKIKNDYPKMKVIITLGKKGSIYFDEKIRYYQDIYPTESIDTTGAGDCFTGYFLGTYVKFKDIKIALKYASCAASLSVRKKGASGSIPKKEEVERLMYNK